MNTMSALLLLLGSASKYQIAQLSRSAWARPSERQAVTVSEQEDIKHTPLHNDLLLFPSIFPPI